MTELRCILFALAMFSFGLNGQALSYETELHAAANKLVSQLEAANQQSGTVIDFTDLQGAPTELGRFLAQELSDQLVSASKKISFVDRANLQVLLRENKLSVDGLVNPQSSRKLGNLIGIDTIIFGTVTPLADKIRLSVRAVAVETGRIVASQASTIAVPAGLGELYNRGVASPSTTVTAINNSAQTPDVRTRFRGDSIKVSAKQAVIAGNGWYTANVTFNLKNLSGIGFGAAIRAGATSIGGCVGQEGQSSGLGLINDQAISKLMTEENPEALLRYFPANGDILVTIILNSCQKGNFEGIKSTDASLSLVVASGKSVVVLPLSASGIPMRMGGW